MARFVDLDATRITIVHEIRNSVIGSGNAYYVIYTPRETSENAVIGALLEIALPTFDSSDYQMISRTLDPACSDFNFFDKRLLENQDSMRDGLDVFVRVKI